jgi:hypothetical protein
MKPTSLNLVPQMGRHFIDNFFFYNLEALAFSQDMYKKSKNKLTKIKNNNEHSRLRKSQLEAERKIESKLKY